MFSGDSREIQLMQQLEWFSFNERLHVQKRKPGLTQNQLRIFAAEHHPMHSFILQAARRKTEEEEQVWVLQSLKTAGVKLLPKGGQTDWK